MNQDNFFERIKGLIQKNNSNKTSSNITMEELLGRYNFVPFSKPFSRTTMVAPFAMNIKYNESFIASYGDLFTKFSNSLPDAAFHNILDDFRFGQSDVGYLQVYSSQHNEAIVDLCTHNYSKTPAENYRGEYGYKLIDGKYYKDLGKKSEKEFYELINGFSHKDLSKQSCISIGITFGFKNDKGSSWIENDHFPNRFYNFVYLVIFNDGSVYSDSNIEYLREIPYTELEKLFNYISASIGSSYTWSNKAYYFEVDVRDCVYSRNRKINILR